MAIEPSILFALDRQDFQGHSPASEVVDRSVGQRFQEIRFRLLTGNGLPPTDEAKLWDARNVMEIATDLPKSTRVLDCGAFNSAPLFALKRAGFKELHGVDLNPNVVHQPYSGRIRYSVQNIEALAYGDDNFDFLTCSSVIEHGVDWDRFLAEAHRVLRANGLLYLSTDVVNDPATAEGVTAFNAPWNPLDSAGVAAAAEKIRKAGFDCPIIDRPELPTRLPVKFAGHELGFVGFVARKREA